MDEKKHPHRFTIVFNMDDPTQRLASEELHRHGRHKARFLAEAINWYVQSGGSQLNQAFLEEIVTNCVNTVLQRLQAESIVPSETSLPQETVPSADAGTAWSSEDLSIIAATLSSFQQ